jgi:hypothetical protein
LDLEVFSFVVYVCVVVDGYTEGECVYDGENAACVFSVYMGLLATVIAFALLAGSWFSDSDSYADMTRFCGCCLSLAFLVCFSYTTHNWHDDGSGDHFTISARAALAFQFFSFVLWAFPSVLVLIYCILDKRDIRRHSIDIGRLSTNPAESGLAFRSEKRLASEEERVNPVLRSVHPSFVTTSYYEGTRFSSLGKKVIKILGHLRNIKSLNIDTFRYLDFKELFVQRMVIVYSECIQESFCQQFCKASMHLIL